MIHINGISKNFGRLQVLRNIDLHLHAGECVALIGPNGCGKTTLIKSILGMALPQQGSITVNGRAIKDDIGYRQLIGYMPQIGRYPENMRIGQVINMLANIRRTDRPVDAELYERFGMAQLLNKRMGTLSGGTIQKVSAVLAFYFGPQILILDEPTAGLDPLSAEILKDKILAAKEKGKLIVISSHLLSELDGLVSEVVFMQEGQIVFHQSVAMLKAATGTNSIAQAIVHVLKGQTV
jgi:Cu-processing system ATP-binding protein